MDDDRRIFPVIIFSCILSAALVGSMAVSPKLISAYGLTATVGFLAYAFSFTITDITCELYGRKTANQVVFGGFIAVIVAFSIIQIAVIIPSGDSSVNQNSFEAVFLPTGRITLAGILAYGASQFLDVYLFSEIRKRTGAKYLWLRNNLSTAISQFVDTAIFITIAFGYSIEMIGGQYILKLVIALADTLVVYLLVFWIRKNYLSVVPVKSV